jgi:hypothetical protein
VRVNAAWHHNTVARFHHAHSGRRGKAARRSNGDDFLARYTDFRWPESIRCYNTIALDHQIHGNTPAWRMVAPSGGSLNPKGRFKPMLISAARWPCHIAGEAGAIGFRHHHTFTHL